MAGEAFTFDDHSTGNITNWSWNFGDGSTYRGDDSRSDSSPIPTCISGSFEVTLTVSNLGTGAHDTVTHTIHRDTRGSCETPAVDFTISPRDSGNRELHDHLPCLDLLHLPDQRDGLAVGDDRRPERHDHADRPVLRRPHERVRAGARTSGSVNHDGVTNNICTVKLHRLVPVPHRSPRRHEDRHRRSAAEGRLPAERHDGHRAAAGQVPRRLRRHDRYLALGLRRRHDERDPEPGARLRRRRASTRSRSRSRATTRRSPAASTRDTVTKTITVEDPVIADFTAEQTEGDAPARGPLHRPLHRRPDHWRWYFGDDQTFDRRRLRRPTPTRRRATTPSP